MAEEEINSDPLTLSAAQRLGIAPSAVEYWQEVEEEQTGPQGAEKSFLGAGVGGRIFFACRNPAQPPDQHRTARTQLVSKQERRQVSDSLASEGGLPGRDRGSIVG